MSLCPRAMSTVRICYGQQVEWRNTAAVYGCVNHAVLAFVVPRWVVHQSSTRCFAGRHSSLRRFPQHSVLVAVALRGTRPHAGFDGSPQEPISSGGMYRGHRGVIPPPHVLNEVPRLRNPRHELESPGPHATHDLAIGLNNEDRGSRRLEHASCFANNVHHEKLPLTNRKSAVSAVHFRVRRIRQHKIHRGGLDLCKLVACIPQSKLPLTPRTRCSLVHVVQQGGPGVLGAQWIEGAATGFAAFLAAAFLTAPFLAPFLAAAFFTGFLVAAFFAVVIVTAPGLWLFVGCSISIDFQSNSPDSRNIT
jgi:hypothetical protein